MRKFRDCSIRPIEEKDLKMVLEWRNSKRIHEMMLTNHKITWDEHLAWFNRNKENNPILNFIFEYKKQPVGYIGYLDYDEKNKTCAISAYLGEENIVADIPIGIALICTQLDYAFETLNMEKVITDVFEKNIKSWKTNKLLGFKFSKETILYQKDGEDEIAFRMVYDKAEWKRKG